MWLALSACDARDAEVAPSYRGLSVPADLLASNEAKQRGAVIFAEKCALCHGVHADGNGVRKQGLSGRPVNFRSTRWRANTSPQEVFALISEGKRGTSMPGWPTLTDAEKWDVVAYVLSVSEDR